MKESFGLIEGRIVIKIIDATKLKRDYSRYYESTMSISDWIDSQPEIVLKFKDRLRFLFTGKLK